MIEFMHELYTVLQLKKKAGGYADNYCELIPEDTDKDGVLELKGTQYVCGWGHSDGLGMATSILKFDINNQKWILRDFTFEEFED